MPQKTGNGGNGPENYDEKTGRYVASSGFSKDEIKKLLDSGQGGAAFQNIWKTLTTDAEKDEFVDWYNERMSEAKTKKLHELEFNYLTEAEYFQMSDDFDNKIPATVTLNGKQYTKEQVLSAWRIYKGGGSTAFNLQKGARILKEDGNLDRFYQIIGESNRNKQYYSGDPDALSEQGVKEWADKIDYLTSCYETTKDFRADRYLDTNWLVGNFKQYLPKSFATQPDGYGYQELANPNVDNMVEFFSGLIGAPLPSDGSCPSVSVVPKNTHMGRKGGVHKSNEKQKLIKLEIDIPKGTNMLMGSYKRESECMLNVKYNYFVKGVKKLDVPAFDEYDKPILDSNGNQAVRTFCCLSLGIQQ